MASGRVRAFRAAIAAMIAMAGFVLAAPPASAALMATSKAWPTAGDGFTHIPVCVRSDSSAVEKANGLAIHDPNPSLATVIGKVRSALRTTWEANTNVRFEGWATCAGQSGIHLWINPTAPNNSYIGTDSLSFGGTTITTQFKPWGNGQQCIRYNAARARVEYQFTCVEQYAIHEFGHVLGLLHEWQTPFTPPSCSSTAPADEQPLPASYDTTKYYIPNSSFDRDSLMTYGDACADVTGERFGSPTPDAFDYLAVQHSYPPETEHAGVVGVLAAHSVSCPDTKVTIHLDTENTDNNNSTQGSTGWSSSTTTDDATLQICPVDGNRLNRLRTPSSGHADFAVLKLSATCPDGSTEFTRYHDDNDGPETNEDWIGGPAGPNEVVGRNTMLHFCLFKSSPASAVTKFPDLLNNYGVFAAADFAGALATGSLYVDDEDTANENALTVDPADAAAVAGIVDGGPNTTYHVATVPVLVASNHDRLAATPVLSASTFTIQDDTTSATHEAGEAVLYPGNRASFWYSWEAPATGDVIIDTCGSPFDTTLSMSTGASEHANLQLLGKDDDSCGARTSRLELPVTGGFLYRIAVDGYGGAVGPFTLHLQMELDNDDLAQATTVTGDHGSVTGTTVGATVEPGEPNAGGGHTIWYRYAPTSNGWFVGDTCGSPAPTQLNGYLGSSMGSLLRIDFDDHRCGGRSRVAFFLQAGNEYRFQVDAPGGVTGATTFAWSFGQANNDFGNAEPLTGSTGVTTQETGFANTEPGEPLPDAGRHTVWYAYTPTATTDLEVDTCGSTYDTTLQLYQGDTLAGLTPLAGDDDSCGYQSRMRASLTAGTPYRIQVNSYDDATGSLRLTWRIGTTVSIGDVQVVETDGGQGALATFPVRLDAASAAPVTVRWNTIDGDATAADDYTRVRGGRLTIRPGRTGATVSVPITHDASAEPTESFTVALSSPAGAVLERAVGTATILDDDGEPGAATVSVGDVTLREGNKRTATIAVDVVLDQSAATDVTIPWSVRGDTATIGTDLPAASGTLVLPAGTLAGTIPVTVRSDTVEEGVEVAYVDLGAVAGAAVGKGTGTLTILDDDGAHPGRGVSVGDVSVLEGDAENHLATVPLRIGRTFLAEVTVDWETHDGTAISGSDFTPRSGTITFPAGTSTASVTVPILADALGEPGFESFTVHLSNPTGGLRIDRADGTVTILDDEGPGPSLSLGSTSVPEGATGTLKVPVTVFLDDPQDVDVSVRVVMAHGTTTATDATIRNVRVTIPAGATSGSTFVTVVGDGFDEGDETVTLSLASPTSALVAGGSGSLTIIDDD